MATTTNYGWTTPDDTSLVKDGAAAIRTLGSSVDTTTKALNPSTTLGDIEYRSATANTNTRLGIGTTGQVLSVSGGVPAWTTLGGGGFTQLANSATTSGSSVSVTGLSGYNSLFCYFEGISMAAANVDLVVTFNNDNGSNYDGFSGRFQIGTSSIPTLFGVNNTTFPKLMAGVSYNAANPVSGFMQIFGANSTGPKVGTLNVWPASTSTNSTAYPQGFRYFGTSVISSIQVQCNSAATTFDAGTFRVLGSVA